MLGSSCSPCCEEKCGAAYLDATAVEVDIVGSDYVVSCGVNNPFVGVQGLAFPYGGLSGTWSLTRQSLTATEASWLSNFGGPVCGLDYSISVNFYLCEPSDSFCQIMTLNVSVPAVFNTKVPINSSAFASVSDFCSTGSPQFGEGNGLPFIQYCDQYNRTNLPIMNVPGIPVINTNDRFNDYGSCFAESRVNVGSYELGVTAVRVYV